MMKASLPLREAHLMITTNVKMGSFELASYTAFFETKKTFVRYSLAS